jgi:hypothetical protein
MRRTAVLGMALAFVLVLGLGSGFALTAEGGDKLSGPHFQFNLIGHPKGGIGGDTSGGRSIMVPLKTANGSASMTCDVDGVVIEDDIAPKYTTQVMGGVKLYFEVSNQVGQFTIVDRDATDGVAKILVPASMLNNDDTIKFDIYIRALGKPNTCMNINAYAFDDAQVLYFYAGSAYISRRTGKSVFVKANDLFDVWWCQVNKVNPADPTTWVCAAGTEVNLSVFDDKFESYFWQILNDGSRNVQVRIYY